MMKLQELKAKVYQLAQVSTTQQLKAKYEAIQTLDMRRKASWERALAIVQEQQKQQNEFAQWLENPPEEYKTLFAEITEASQKYDRKSAETRQLAQEVLSIANNLEEVAEDCRGEAEQLEREVRRTIQISEQANLN
jgi:CRISPR/Cas system-associated endonuclease Cas3-HD